VKLEKYRYNTFEILIENSEKTLFAGKKYIILYLFYLTVDKIFSLLTFVQLQKLLKDKKNKNDT
jgi:hypothetical protein